jgi:hypothetical protein
MAGEPRFRAGTCCGCGGGGTTRTISISGCGFLTSQGSGATVTITGPSPATDVVCSGTANSSGIFTCSLTNGTYSYTITQPRYATATGTFTHSGTGTTSVSLSAASGYACTCHCSNPIPTTLTMTNDHGAVTLTWYSSRGYYFGCQDIPFPQPNIDPGTNGCLAQLGTDILCDDTTDATVTMHWFLWCSGCLPNNIDDCGANNNQLVGLIYGYQNCSYIDAFSVCQYALIACDISCSLPGCWDTGLNPPGPVCPGDSFNRTWMVGTILAGQDTGTPPSTPDCLPYYSEFELTGCGPTGFSWWNVTNAFIAGFGTVIIDE